MHPDDCTHLAMLFTAEYAHPYYLTSQAMDKY